MSGNKNVDKNQPQVSVFDPVLQQWQGPCKLFTWGRGYACVSTGNEQPHWIPAKWVKPWIERPDATNNSEEQEQEAAETSAGPKALDRPTRQITTETDSQCGD